MSNTDFYDLMTIDATQWGREIDPIGLLAYQNYRRKRLSEAAPDFFGWAQLARVSYRPKDGVVTIVKRHHETRPIQIKMTQAQWDDFQKSQNKKRWLNQKIKAKELELKEDLDQLDEALTLQQRMRRKIIMRRLAPRLARARKIAMRRRAGTDVLKRRARTLARKTMAKKLLGGRNKSDVSASERARIEKILAKKKGAIDRIAARMLPVVRKKQALRFAAKKAPAKKTTSSTPKPAPKPAAKPAAKKPTPTVQKKPVAPTAPTSNK